MDSIMERVEIRGSSAVVSRSRTSTAFLRRKELGSWSHLRTSCLRVARATAQGGDYIDILRREHLGLFGPDHPGEVHPHPNGTKSNLLGDD